MREILFKYMNQLTSMSEAEQQALMDEIRIKEYRKGTVLLRQGEVPTKCYFVLQGCVRQYAVNEAGKEITSNFFTEEQAVAIYQAHSQGKASDYAFACLEDSVLVVGELEVQADMFNKYDQLESLTRKMVEQKFGEMQDEYALFIASTPEERFKSLLRRRPQLIDRVSQHQLASYLGMTPESLSRIKKRVQQDGQSR